MTVTPLLDAHAGRDLIHQPVKVIDAVPTPALFCPSLPWLGRKVVKFLVVRVPRYFHIFVSGSMIHIDGLV